MPEKKFVSWRRSLWHKVKVYRRGALEQLVVTQCGCHHSVADSTFSGEEVLTGELCGNCWKGHPSHVAAKRVVLVFEGEEHVFKFPARRRRK